MRPAPLNKRLFVFSLLEAVATARWFATLVTLVAMAGIVWRALVIIHRYLGIAVGLLILSWFFSGTVMMYVGFPRPAREERLRGLPPIAWVECCHIEAASVSDGQPVARAEIEMALGTSGAAPPPACWCPFKRSS